VKRDAGGGYISLTPDASFISQNFFLACHFKDCIVVVPSIGGNVLSESQQIRAVSMLSGGLDSMLAARVLQEQGIHVEGVTFESPFFGPENAKRAADQLNIALHIVDFTYDIIDVLKKPKHGFGKCMNPCIDCHATMMRRSGELMDTLGFHFIATGEVLDQRPMSQNMGSLATVTSEFEYDGWILRPLSAQLLPITKPEEIGWVDRSALLAIHGKRRKEQMDLAKKYGLNDYPSPAGGCLLTDPGFSRRLSDIRKNGNLDDVRGLHLLRIGRHIRLSSKTKLIVGRNQEDNTFIEDVKSPDDIILVPKDVMGPTCLLPAGSSKRAINKSAAICACYSDIEDGAKATIAVTSGEETSEIVTNPALKEDIKDLLL
jgi:tRNA U34 2-thiouridine synthase MnmA/TrmU